MVYFTGRNRVSGKSDQDAGSNTGDVQRISCERSWRISGKLEPAEKICGNEQRTSGQNGVLGCKHSEKTYSDRSDDLHDLKENPSFSVPEARTTVSLRCGVTDVAMVSRQLTAPVHRCVIRNLETLHSFTVYTATVSAYLARTRMEKWSFPQRMCRLRHIRCSRRDFTKILLVK